MRCFRQSKALVGYFCISMAVLGSAASTTARAQVQDYFWALQDYFQKGDVLYLSEFAYTIEGYNTGRCYSAQTPDKAEAALMAGIQTQIGDDNGPLFPGVREKRYFIIKKPGASPSYYDGLGDSEAVQAEVEEEIRNNLGFFETAVDDPNGIISRGMNGYVMMYLKRERVYYSYSVVKVETGGNLTEMCYFFQRVGGKKKSN